MKSNVDSKSTLFNGVTWASVCILFLPISIKLAFPSISAVIIYPAELIIGATVILFFLDFIFHKGRLAPEDRPFYKHPLSLLVLLYLGATLFSAFKSTMPIVSLKAVIVQLSYVIVFYFVVGVLVKRSSVSYLKMFGVYAISLSMVIGYTLFNHSQQGLQSYASGYMSSPFYNDHTIYGAAIAFLLPSFLAMTLKPRLFKINIGFLMPVIGMLIVLIAGLYFSFSRAAWVSVLSGLSFFLFLKIGFRFYAFAFIIVLGIALGLFNKDSLVNSFQKNRISSDTDSAGVYDQFASLTNITNDVSNAERLNRWSCAARMSFDRPWFGYGPGTYQFQYLSYQRPEEMTSISVRIPVQQGSTIYSWLPIKGYSAPSGEAILQGDRGTAHSEYFLALSETGYVTTLLFLSVLVFSFYRGIKFYSSSIDSKRKTIVVIAMLGLVTYFTHGLFNNFLDDCKMAFLFWSSLSCIAAIDSDQAVSQKETFSDSIAG